MSEAVPEQSALRAHLTTLRRSALAQGVLLGLFALVTAVILSFSDDLTRDAIRLRVAEDLVNSLAQVIPADLHDNDPTADKRVLTDAEEGEVTAFIASKNNEVTAVAYDLTGYGYGGAIRVLMAITPDGTLLGVRVLTHTETPGLGDKIEVEKSDWIKGFAGRSLRDPTPEGWKVQRDGGVFDQFSGATITPRAVVGAIRRGLTLFERQQTSLLAPLSPPEN